MSSTTDPTAALYFNEVGKQKLPTKEEEVRLFTEYKKAQTREQLGRSAKDREEGLRDRLRIGQEIACGYVRFVIKQAHRKTNDPQLLKDLISEGNIGLMRGVERFELSYKVRFLTYAASWIDVHMQEHLHKLGIVHVPSHTRKAMNKQRKQENQLGSYAPQASTAMREPTTTTLDDVDAPADDDTEQAAQHSECNLFEYMEQADLTRCERLVLIYYFGLRGTEMEADELVQFFYELDGSLFNANQISRMASEAMLKLKTLLHEKGVTTLNDVL